MLYRLLLLSIASLAEFLFVRLAEVNHLCSQISRLPGAKPSNRSQPNMLRVEFSDQCPVSRSRPA